MGKGGVGKTTVAAASAILAAESGQRVVVTSTDPAHSLGDVLGRRIGSVPVQVTPGCCLLYTSRPPVRLRRVHGGVPTEPAGEPPPGRPAPW